MTNLKRTKLGVFDIKDSVSLEEFEKDPIKHIISLEEILKENESIILNNKKLELFLNGVKLKENKKDGLYKIYNDNIFIGTGTIKENILKRDIILKDSN